MNIKEGIVGWGAALRRAWPLTFALIAVSLFVGLLIRGCSFQRPMEFERDDYFIPNQIILTGPTQDAIESALDGIPQAALVENSVITINLEDVLEGNDFCPGLPSSLTDKGNYVIALAEFDDNSTTVENVIAGINVAGVTAEPNLITGSPNYPTGSTVTWPFASADSQDYLTQWAFTNIQRGIPDVNEAGRRIRVIVFDTVPTLSGEIQSVAEGSPGKTTFRSVPFLVDWVDPDAPMILDLGYAWEYAKPASATAPEDLGLSHHGLFAAQMVHAIAPASDIELIRVLDSGTHGNLYTLIVGLYDNLLYKDPNKDPDLRRIVVNMSLGIRIPPPMADFQLPELGIEALHTIVQLAHCRNIVIVAASGNNSIMSYPPEMAHLPADWSSVIAVAASNSANQRSCFSNQGDIAAPGGDGRKPDEDPPPMICEARLTECVDGNCPYAVVGPIVKSNEFPTGLIYWEGSSFASPMVAGLAARILAEGPPDLTPDNVRYIIECGATEAQVPDGIAGHPDRHIGEGVINVQRTLADCMPPANN